MREHEVPTHVQAEDRVLLWFTFPQIVAITAVCALSYGAYRYAPGPSELRIALGVVFGIAGIVAVVGKIGGRALPLAAADLLKFRLGVRRYAGPVDQLVRSEPPAPVQSGPNPLSLMVRSAVRGSRRMRVMAGHGLLRLRRGGKRRRGGRQPFRPHGWFGKRRRRGEKENEDINRIRAAAQRTGRRRSPKAWIAAAALTVLAASAVPHVALADDRWPDEIEFEMLEPVPGRRLFVEGLEVTGDRANVTLRAATDLDIRVRAYGGREGRMLRFWGRESLEEGERIDYSLPLHGESPSLTFSWEDAVGQAGAVALKGGQIPYPLPAVEGELCKLRVTSLEWIPGAVEGIVEAECVSDIEKVVHLPTSAGHHTLAVSAVMDAEVTAVAGTVTVSGGESHTSVPAVPDGESAFRLDVPTGEAVHALTIEADLEATLRIPMPSLVRLTHHPERTEQRTRTVRLVRPGASRTVSETVVVENPDGTETEHTISAHLSIPSEVVYRDVTLTVIHPERVDAEVVERSPSAGSRSETLSLASRISSDAPFKVLVVPQPGPEPAPAEQTLPTDGDLQELFDILGWEWPW